MLILSVGSRKDVVQLQCSLLCLLCLPQPQANVNITLCLVRVRLLPLNPELVERYSPSAQVDRETPPAYLYGLCTDQLLSPDHVLDYARACQQYDVPFELHLYGYGLHGAGVAAADPRLNWQASLKHWLATQGFLKE